jgi:hypothetical protein
MWQGTHNVECSPVGGASLIKTWCIYVYMRGVQAARASALTERGDDIQVGTSDTVAINPSCAVPSGHAHVCSAERPLPGGVVIDDPYDPVVPLPYSYAGVVFDSNSEEAQEIMETIRMYDTWFTMEAEENAKSLADAISKGATADDLLQAELNIAKEMGMICNDVDVMLF